MTESLLALVPTYGLPFIFGISVLAAAGVPLSSSLTLLAAGAFIASGELDVAPAFLWALAGAVIGDQIGFQIGLRAGSAIEVRLNRNPSRALKIQRSKRFIDRFGGVGVFLTRWLTPPIGPATNVVCGAGDMRWLRFTAWDFVGEAIWVGLYIGLGYTVRGNIEEVAGTLGDISWFLIAGLVTVVLGYRILTVFRKHSQKAGK